MFKIKVTEKSGAFCEYIDNANLVERLHRMGHGLPERWVPHKDEPMAESYDEADVLDERVVEDEPAVEPVLISEGIPAKPAVYDNGNLISEATEEVPAVYTEGVPAKTHKEVKLKAEYTVEIEDITAQLEQEKINKESLEYLASTDWLVIREMDAGIPCPAEIKAERAAARARIVR
jgi:hypothetical protein